MNWLTNFWSRKKPAPKGNSTEINIMLETIKIEEIVNETKTSIIRWLNELRFPIVNGQTKQYKGLLIKCSICWNSRDDYDTPAKGDKDDYASIEIWYDNSKNRNDPSNRIKATAYRKKVGGELWETIKYEYNNNRNEYTFYSIKVDENNEVLDFKRERGLEKLVSVGRSAGGLGQEVFLL